MNVTPFICFSQSQLSLINLGISYGVKEAPHPLNTFLSIKSLGREDAIQRNLWFSDIEESINRKTIEGKANPHLKHFEFEQYKNLINTFCWPSSFRSSFKLSSL